MSKLTEDDYLDLNDDSRAEQLRHAEVLRKYEAQKRGRSVALPTSIGKVAKLQYMHIYINIKSY